jgi:hypothetical protein
MNIARDQPDLCSSSEMRLAGRKLFIPETCFVRILNKIIFPGGLILAAHSSSGE